jgi:predicted Zn-ribbon and HTH transcriptional regulator
MPHSLPVKTPGRVSITRIGWRCLRCGHEWVPKREGFAPATCPKCKSPYWNRPRRRATPAKLNRQTKP